MIRVMAIAAALCLLAPAASAQQSNPIMDNYRAYQSALERNDLPAAEANAAAAFEAAQAASDPRAGALAINLAIVRLLRGDAANAIAPAQTGLAYALENPASGVAPAMAELVLARAELGAGADGAPERLNTALEAALAASLPEAEIYDAAIELAAWAQRSQRHDLARSSWAIAEDFAHGSTYPLAYARGLAKLGHAVAIIQMEQTQRGARSFDEANAAEAYQLLSEACALLASLAAQDLPSGELTLAQHTFAQVLAWRAVIRAKMRSDGQSLPAPVVAEGDGLFEDIGAPRSLTVERCLVSTSLRRPIEYPSGAARRGELAGAAVRLRINADGQVTEARVVARVGSEDFLEAIDESASSWTVTRRPDSQPNCRMEMTLLRAISFSFDQSSAPEQTRGRTRRPS